MLEKTHGKEEVLSCFRRRKAIIIHQRLRTWGTGKEQLCCVIWRNSEKKGGKGGEILI